ncbi:hypothetical protein GQ55_2G150000 [Panicum hallii var. hallii]|uniref:Uncharacterized protein n=1 Tax=Panicum hallii var. hallii TaxID=1504633 RepID=A0A2T7EPT6_9POAL|nr:hypothetical protein GQ55_2G150000 [Panicum hallii var. hallii]
MLISLSIRRYPIPPLPVARLPPPLPPLPVARLPPPSPLADAQQHRHQQWLNQAAAARGCNASTLRSCKPSTTPSPSPLPPRRRGMSSFSWQALRGEAEEKMSCIFRI